MILSENLTNTFGTALEQLRSLLKTKARMEVERTIAFEQPLASVPPSPGQTCGWVLKGEASQGEIKLVILTTKSLQPRQVDGVVFRLQTHYPGHGSEQGVHHLVIAPQLSEKVRNRLEAEKVGWFDFGCNIDLELGSGYLHIEGRPTPPQYRERRTQRSLFTPKASRLLRILLQGPLRSWKVEELAEASGVSLGLVSKVRKLLLEHEVAREDQGGIRITEPDEILDEWNREDDWKKRTESREYSLLENDPEKITENLERILGPQKFAYTGSYGAYLRKPYALPDVTTLYVEKFPDDDLFKEKLHARRVDRGGGLQLVKPKDEGVFFPLQKLKGKKVVCDVQLYLDVIRAGQRGVDAAEILRAAKDFSGGWK